MVNKIEAEIKIDTKKAQLDINALNSVMNKLLTSFQKTEKSAEQLAKEADSAIKWKLSKALDTAALSAQKLQDKLTIRWESASKIAEYKKSVDWLIASYRNWWWNINTFKAEMNKINESFKQWIWYSTSFWDRLKNIAKSYLWFNLITNWVNLLTWAIKSSFNAAVEYDRVWASTVKRLSGSSKEIATLRKDLLSLSETIPVSFWKLANIAEIAWQLWVATKDISVFTESIARVTAITWGNVEETATAIAKLATIFKIPYSDIDRLTWAAVKLWWAFAADEDEIVNFSKQIASAWQIAWLTAEQILAIATSFIQVWVPAERWWSAINRVLIDLTRFAKEWWEELNRVAEITWVTASEFQKMFQQNAWEAFLRFMQWLWASTTDTTWAIWELFGENIRTIQSFTTASKAADVLSSALKTVWNSATDIQNNIKALYSVTDELFSSQSSSLDILTNKWENLQAKTWWFLLENTVRLTSFVWMLWKTTWEYWKLKSSIDETVQSWAAFNKRFEDTADLANDTQESIALNILNTKKLKESQDEFSKQEFDKKIEKQKNKFMEYVQTLVDADKQFISVTQWSEALEIWLKNINSAISVAQTLYWANSTEIANLIEIRQWYINQLWTEEKSIRWVQVAFRLTNAEMQASAKWFSVLSSWVSSAWNAFLNFANKVWVSKWALSSFKNVMNSITWFFSWAITKVKAETTPLTEQEKQIARLWELETKLTRQREWLKDITEWATISEKRAYAQQKIRIKETEKEIETLDKLINPPEKSWWLSAAEKAAKKQEIAINKDVELLKKKYAVNAELLDNAITDEETLAEVKKYAYEEALKQIKILWWSKEDQLELEKLIAKEEWNRIDSIAKKEKKRIEEIKKLQDDLTKNIKGNKDDVLSYFRQHEDAVANVTKKYAELREEARVAWLEIAQSLKELQSGKETDLAERKKKLLEDQLELENKLTQARADWIRDYMIENISESSIRSLSSEQELWWIKSWDLIKYIETKKELAKINAELLEISKNTTKEEQASIDAQIDTTVTWKILKQFNEEKAQLEELARIEKAYAEGKILTEEEWVTTEWKLLIIKRNQKLQENANDLAEADKKYAADLFNYQESLNKQLQALKDLNVAKKWEYQQATEDFQQYINDMNSLAFQLSDEAKMLVGNPWVRQSDAQFLKAQEIVNTTINKNIWQIINNNVVDYELFDRRYNK